MPGAAEMMVEKLLIREVLQRYCRGVDRLDKELIDSVYWDDAIIDHGSNFAGPGKEFSAYVIPAIKSYYAMSMHTIHQSNITVNMDRAASETYFIAYNRRLAPFTEIMDVVAGRYVDILEKRNDEWRIMGRNALIDWVQTRRDVDLPPFELDNVEVGRGDRSDRSYTAIEEILR